MKAYKRIQRSWLDFLLAGLAAALTTFSLGISLSYINLGLVFVGMIAVGNLVSWRVSRMQANKWIHRIGMVLYLLSAIASPFVAFHVNAYLPGEGFPRELLFSAAPLTWMLAMGSFFAWRDSTLLFQCVPCIALFGLVGAFNTFDGATATFFLFLFSGSILYARTHQRAMLERAEQSGYPRIQSIHRGPWRYVAGPEWGLLSAAIVIVLSAISAPILQLSARQVSGVVTVRPPSVQPPAPTSMPSAMAMGENRKVGQGPIGRLSTRELFRVKTPEPKYLRVSPFNVYANGTWSKQSRETPRLQANPGESPFPFITQKILDDVYTLAPFSIKFTGGTPAKLPIPTPFNRMETRAPFTMALDGTVAVPRTYDPDRVLSGSYFARKPEIVPSMSPKSGLQVEFYKNAESIPPKIVALAKEVASGAQNDYQIALALKREVEKRSRYNLNAEAAPEGEDPVEWFLFGPNREGYCDLFASSLALLARGAGLPARYVIGYYPVNLEKDELGFYVLRESDAHAWTEIYFEGVGWIPFDATEGAVQVPGGERGSAPDSESLFEKQGFWLFASIGLVVVAAGVVGIGLWRKAMARTPDEILLTRLGRAYESFISTVEGVTGLPRWNDESPNEFAKRALPNLPTTMETVSELAKRFSTAFYGPTAPNAVVMTEVEEEVAALQASAKAYAKQRRKGIINHR